MRQLRSALPPGNAEVADAWIAWEEGLWPFNRSQGLAILHADRLELVPVWYGHAITVPLADIVAAKESRWIYVPLFWKRGFKLMLATGRQVGVALPEPYARRWQAQLNWKGIPAATETQNMGLPANWLARHWKTMLWQLLLIALLALGIAKFVLPDNKAAAEAKTAGAESLGPVIEAVVNDMDDGRGNEALNLRTGKLLSLPDGFGNGWTEAMRQKWLADNAVDLLADFARNQWAIFHRGVSLGDMSESQWDRGTTAEVDSAVAAESRRLEVRTNRGGAFYLLPADAAPPMTFAFETAAGTRGILQIASFIDDPRGLKLRYKLAASSQEMPSTVVADSQAGSAQTVANEENPSLARTESAESLLNEDQRLIEAWTERQFGAYFDRRTFAGWSEKERADLETRLIDALNGPKSRDYYQAINTLAALHSKEGLRALREIAFDRRDKNNRDRWMAIRALGLIGEPADVPELIHLVYHGNINTRWWAQISLVRLTQRNFGKDWNAWGRWWNERHGQPPFQPEIVRWWKGQAEPEQLAETLEENDRKFFEDLKAKSESAPKPAEAAPSGPSQDNPD